MNAKAHDDKTPTVHMELPEFVRAIVDHAMAQHQNACPMVPRIARMEIRFATLLGWMAGSGLGGGVAGALLSKMIGG